MTTKKTTTDELAEAFTELYTAMRDKGVGPLPKCERLLEARARFHRIANQPEAGLDG